MTLCRIYQGKLQFQGYPDSFSHRIICEQQNGPCPPGYEASHICNNRACQEPTHLVWETRSQNNLRKSKEVRLKSSKAGNKALQSKARGWTYYPQYSKPYYVRFNGKCVGYFKTQTEAERAYKEALINKYG